MIMLKSAHEAAMENLRLTHKLELERARTEHAREVQTARDEATALRFEVIAEKNTNATLRGRAGRLRP